MLNAPTNYTANLASVAFTGSYVDLINQPEIGSVAYWDKIALLQPGDVVVIGVNGQSTISGNGGGAAGIQAIPTDGSQDPIPGVFYWDWNNGTTQRLAIAGYPFRKPFTAVSMNQMMTFLKLFKSRLPVGVNLVLVDYSHGGTGYFDADPNNWKVGGTYAQRFLDMMNACLTAIYAAGSRPFYFGMCEAQGENDADKNPYLWLYEKSRTHAWFRKNIVSPGNLQSRAEIYSMPIIHNDFPTQAKFTNVLKKGRSSLMAIHASRQFGSAFCQADSPRRTNTILDNTHLDNEGHVIMGERAFSLLPFAFANKGVLSQAISIVGAPWRNGTVAVSSKEFIGLEDFKVQYKLASSGTWLDFATTRIEGMIEITGLTNGSSYNFRVINPDAGWDFVGTPISNVLTITPTSQDTCFEFFENPTANATDATAGVLTDLEAVGTWTGRYGKTFTAGAVAPTFYSSGLGQLSRDYVNISATTSLVGDAAMKAFRNGKRWLMWGAELVLSNDGSGATATLTCPTTSGVITSIPTPSAFGTDYIPAETFAAISGATGSGAIVTPVMRATIARWEIVNPGANVPNGAPIVITGGGAEGVATSYTCFAVDGKVQGVNAGTSSGFTSTPTASVALGEGVILKPIISYGVVRYTIVGGGILYPAGGATLTLRNNAGTSNPFLLNVGRATGTNASFQVRRSTSTVPQLTGLSPGDNGTFTVLPPSPALTANQNVTIRMFVCIDLNDASAAQTARYRVWYSGLSGAAGLTGLTEDDLKLYLNATAANTLGALMPASDSAQITLGNDTFAGFKLRTHGYFAGTDDPSAYINDFVTCADRALKVR